MDEDGPNEVNIGDRTHTRRACDAPAGKQFCGVVLRID